MIVVEGGEDARVDDVPVVNDLVADVRHELGVVVREERGSRVPVVAGTVVVGIDERLLAPASHHRMSRAAERNPGQKQGC